MLNQSYSSLTWCSSRSILSRCTFWFLTYDDLWDMKCSSLFVCCVYTAAWGVGCWTGEVLMLGTRLKDTNWICEQQIIAREWSSSLLSTALLILLWLRWKREEMEGGEEERGYTPSMCVMRGNNCEEKRRWEWEVNEGWGGLRRQVYLAAWQRRGGGNILEWDMDRSETWQRKQKRPWRE